MDIFVEQIVKKQPSAKDTVLKTLTGLATGLAGLILFAASFIFGPLLMILTVGVVYIGYMLTLGYNCEYEYIVTNGELDVDKIIARRKRRRLLTVKASDFERYGEYKDAPEADKNVTLVLAAGIETGRSGGGETGGNTEGAAYFADFKHKTLGHVRLIFTPNEKVREAVKPYLPRVIRKNIH